MGRDFSALLFVRQTSSEWEAQCEIENFSLIEWRKDTAGWLRSSNPWGPQLAVPSEWPHLSSAYLSQVSTLWPVLALLLYECSVILRSELASDSFGKNLLEIVYLLSALGVTLCLREFDQTLCWRVEIRFLPGSAAFGVKHEPIKFGYLWPRAFAPVKSR